MSKALEVKDLKKYYIQKKVVKKVVAPLAVVFNCPKCGYPKCCNCTMYG